MTAIAAGCHPSSPARLDGGGDGGEAFTDGGPHADGAPAEVAGTVADVYVTAGGDIKVLADLGAAPVEAYVDDGTGALVRYPGRGDADGTFSVPGVPPGKAIYLRLGNTYYHTARRQFELGSVYVQRPDAAAPTQMTPLQLDLSGLDGWKDGDALELVSPTGGVRMRLDGTSTSGGLTIAATATSVSGAVDYDQLSSLASPPLPLIDTSKGDDVFVYQRVARTSGSLTYSALERVLQPSSLVMTDGRMSSLSGPMQAVMTQETLDIDWRGARWDAIGTAMCSAPISRSTGISVHAVPLGAARGGVAAGAPVLADTVADPDTAETSYSLRYGDPFPTTWDRELVGYAQCTERVGADSLPMRSVVAEPAKTGRAEMLAPGIAAPGTISIGGTAAVTERTITTHTPTLSWQPPAFGTPTSYVVKVWDVTQARALAASIVTTATSARIPPPILGSGHTYVFQVRAVKDPNDDPFGRDWRRMPRAFSDAATAPVLVN